MNPIQAKNHRQHHAPPGAGKTTLAKAVNTHFPAFHRISVDEIVHANHGIYGTDYPASIPLYNTYLDEAGAIYLARYKALLAANEDIILERSFYAKEDRDEFRGMAEAAGARVVLAFLRAKEKEVLWERIVKRSQGAKTAHSSFDISRETFDMYWAGFENPVGEGEIVVEVT